METKRHSLLLESVMGLGTKECSKEYRNDVCESGTCQMRRELVLISCEFGQMMGISGFWFSSNFLPMEEMYWWSKQPEPKQTWIITELWILYQQFQTQFALLFQYTGDSPLGVIRGAKQILSQSIWGLWIVEFHHFQACATSNHQYHVFTWIKWTIWSDVT